MTPARCAPLCHYSARVKGGLRAICFFCGVSPFFAPQKNQKNRGSVQKLCRNSELDTWVNEKTAARNGPQPVRLIIGRPAEDGRIPRSNRRPRGVLSVFAPISESVFINSRPAKAAGPVVAILAACCGSESSENNLTVRVRGLTFRVRAMPALSVRPRSGC